MIEGLVNPLTNFPLRIDYFAESIPLTVEYHGEQHFKNVDWFRHPDRKTKWSLKGQKARDKIKADFLKKRGIPLVVFSYKDNICTEAIVSKLQKYIQL
ncbi:hypothetical protein [Brevibacillus sp. H7]|uniref:hypothetical protein n=1 Tax=Brevibacillus sp. H7 TaxID=3349138 RepID=UPI00380E5648